MKCPENTIWFYSHRSGDYIWCSSFYPKAPFSLDGQKWNDRETYFQWKKFSETDKNQAIKIARSLNSFEAKRLGNDRSKKIRPNWDNVKFDIMCNAIRAQCDQNQHLKDKLLATGDKILVEHTENDRIWGDGGNGTGMNLLGKAWMKVREELKK